jgi:hypothetical protein
MAILVGSGKRLTTDDGIPYMWQSGDVTTTPNEVGIITASDGAADDWFGYSVAVGCGRVVVGAYRKDINSYSEQGSVYIFDLDGNEVGIITASDGTPGDLFGRSVAVGCGKIIVGADGDADNGAFTGSFYIYDLDGTNEVKKLASDRASYDFFGLPVAVGCGKIIVAAPGDDDNGANSGSAYIYDLDGTNEVKITASDGATYEGFGRSVAVGCGKIVVGANGDTNTNGAAYIYNLDGSNEVKITASDGAANDEFGYSVAVGSGRIVVGAYHNDINSNANQGAAYIFDLDGNQLGIITAFDGAEDDYYGYSVAVGSGRIVVGASYDDVGANNNQGSAYVYDLDGNEVGIITASNGAAADLFGYSVAVGSGRIVVGAHGANIGSNADQGSAYIYNTPLVYNLYDAIDLNYG